MDNQVAPYSKQLINNFTGIIGSDQGRDYVFQRTLCGQVITFSLINSIFASQAKVVLSALSWKRLAAGLENHRGSKFQNNKINDKAQLTV